MIATSLKHTGTALAAALLLSTAGVARGGTLAIDVFGILSMEERGSSLNELRTFAFTPGARIVGLSWDVELLADAPSFLSEMSVFIGNGAGDGFELAPGFASPHVGVESFSSGGTVDLVDAAADFEIDASGVLSLEFFETINDFVADWDGIWLSGSMTVSYIPEPETFGLAALALLGVGLGSTRRRAGVVKA